MPSTFGSGGWVLKLSGVERTQEALQQVSTSFEGDAVYVAGPTVEYAVHQERGTSTQPARPFLRPARQEVASQKLKFAQQMSRKHGIPLDSMDNITHCVALAVSERSAQIADQKGVRDTGALIESHTVRRK